MSHERRISKTRKRTISMYDCTNGNGNNSQYPFGIHDLNTGLYYIPTEINIDKYINHNPHDTRRTN